MQPAHLGVRHEGLIACQTVAILALLFQFCNVILDVVLPTL